MTAPAYSSSASAAGSGTVAKPANTGGILVLIGAVYDDATVAQGEASPPTVVGSEPWTLQGFAAQGTTDQFTASWIWTKPAEDGTDPANFTWTETTSGTYLESIILRYTHPDGVPSVNAVGTSIANRSASGNIPAVTTTVDDCTIVGVRIGYDDAVSVAPSGFTERVFMDIVNYAWDRTATPAGTFGPTSMTFAGTDGNVLHSIALGPPSGGTAGGTIDPTALVPIFRTIRWLPVWTGSPGADAPSGDITVDASVEVGIVSSSTVTPEPSAAGNVEVGVVSGSTVTPEPAAVGNVEVGITNRAGAVAEPSALSNVEVGITSRSTVTPEPAAVSQTFVGVVPRSQPAADTDLTVTAGVFVGVVSRSTVTPEPSTVTRAVVGVVSRTTYTPEPSAASRAVVGVTARADASVTVTTTTTVLVGVIPRSDLTPANDVTVTAAVVVGTVTRTTYSPNITPTATAQVGVISRATPTITVQGTGRVLVGVAPTSQPTITLTTTSRTFVGVVLSNTLVPLGAILVDRIDVYIEPGPATYQEPAPIVWVEPTKAGYEEPVPDGWREPNPAEGVSL